MALTNLIDTLGLRKLFQKAESGDPQAKKAVQAFQEAPELTGAAFASPAKPDFEVDLAGLLQSLPLGKTGGSLGQTPTFAPQRPEIKVEGDFSQRDPKRFLGMTGDTWKNIAIGAQDAIGGYLRAGGHAAPTGGFAGKFRQEQQDQLARRHQMWDGAFQQSQALPPEVLTDPKFASLANAKAALDKDMADGKVDNEKNVSMFLTEIQRFRPELEQVGMLSKIRAQVAGEGALQQGREAAGLVEPNVEGNLGGHTFKAPASFWKKQEQQWIDEDTAKQQRAEDLKFRREQLEEQIRGRKDVAAINAAARADARQLAADNAERVRTVNNINTFMDNTAKRFAQPDDNGRYQVDDTAMARAAMENRTALLEAGKKMGVNLDVLRARFGEDEEADFLMQLWQIIQSR